MRFGARVNGSGRALGWRCWNSGQASKATNGKSRRDASIARKRSATPGRRGWCTRTASRRSEAGSPESTAFHQVLQEPIKGSKHTLAPAARSLFRIAGTSERACAPGNSSNGTIQEDWGSADTGCSAVRTSSCTGAERRLAKRSGKEAKQSGTTPPLRPCTTIWSPCRPASEASFRSNGHGSMTALADVIGSL